MPLVEIALEPGLYTESTSRGAKNHWRVGDKIRFRYGLPEKLKGWVAYEDATDTPIQIDPLVNAFHSWTSLDGQKWLAIGTTQKLWLLNNGLLFDITPIVASGTLTNPFTTENGESLVTVTHANHGVQEGQLVRYSGASAVGGLTLNGEFTVESVTDIDNYVIDAGSNANADTTGGGTVSYEYEIPPPPGASMFVGYGYGPYGQDDDPNYIGTGYGTPRLAQNLPTFYQTWSLDNWGEDLIASRRGDVIYTWDRSNGPEQRAVLIANAPITNNRVIVSPEDRIVISLGSHDGTTQDQSLIRWSDQENYDSWTVAEGSAAGDKRLDSGSRIVTGIRTRGEIIIFTDEAICSMSPTNTPGDYQFQPKGEALTIVGPNAVVDVSGVLYAMVYDEFVAYDGIVRILPCTVRNHVFDSINRDQIEKVYAAVNQKESEVWWFYPSSESTNNDSYVVYNYREGFWFYGTMARTAYIDAGFEAYPIAADPSGNLYLQENGYMADTAQMPSYVESYDMEIQDIGNQFAHVSEFIPDFLELEGQLKLTFWTRKYPRAEAIVKGPYLFDEDRQKVNLRARGRQIGIRIDDVTTKPATADILELPLGSSLTLSNGNKTVTQSVNGAWDTAFGDDGRSSGKYVVEFAFSAPGATDPYNLFVGIANANDEPNINPASPVALIRGIDGDIYTLSTVVIYADITEGKGWISVNGNFLNGDPLTGEDESFLIPAGTWYPVITLFNQITVTYRSGAEIETDLPNGWLPWAGTTEVGVTTPNWRFGTLRVMAQPDGSR